MLILLCFHNQLSGMSVNRISNYIFVLFYFKLDCRRENRGVSSLYVSVKVVSIQCCLLFWQYRCGKMKWWAIFACVYDIHFRKQAFIFLGRCLCMKKKNDSVKWGKSKEKSKYMKCDVEVKVRKISQWGLLFGNNYG